MTSVSASEPVSSAASSAAPPANPYAAGASRGAPPSALVVAVRRFWADQGAPAPGWVLAVSGAVGVISSVLLVGHRPGLGAALAWLLLWSAALPHLLRRKAFGDLAMAGLSVALAAVLAVRDAGWVGFVSLVAAGGCAVVVVTSSRSAPAVLLSAIGWLAGAARSAAWLGRGLSAATSTRRRLLAGTLISLGVTVLLLVVFGALFASADRVFASYLPRPHVDLLPGRFVVAALLAVVCATSGQLLQSPPPTNDVRIPQGRAVRRWEWVLPVLSLDLLVWAFVLVQVSALLGGHRHVLQTAGLTYAEYTRQGFAQLVAATALTLAVVAAAVRRAPRSGDRDRLVVRLSLGALCVGTLGVVASALRRVDLYVEAFGLTRLRLLVIAGELALGVVVLLVIVAGVRWRAGWLPRAVVVVAAVATLALGAVNPEAQIVRYNAAASSVSGVDTGYLSSLSADAVPAIAALPEPLRSCVLAGMHRDASTDLAGWNLGRSRAARVAAPRVDRQSCGSAHAPAAAPRGSPQNERR